MKQLTLILVFLFVFITIASCAAEERLFSYRFADAAEASALLLSNRDFFESLTQSDLDYRMQKKGATLEELEAFAAAQTRDFTAAERVAVDGAMAAIEHLCRERGYALPAVDEIAFSKTTMREECGEDAYTHGAQVYLGESALRSGASGSPNQKEAFRRLVTHELFHILTRGHPEFRRDMYALLGFTVADGDYAFAPAIRDAIVTNPDVEHHDACAAFDIDGQLRDCVVVFTAKPFERPGDSFRAIGATGLVPVDDLSTLYAADDAANFWDVFGRNTDYAIDPEEVLADNFADAILYGPDGRAYQSPGTIAAIDALLRGGAW